MIGHWVEGSVPFRTAWGYIEESFYSSIRWQHKRDPTSLPENLDMIVEINQFVPKQRQHPSHTDSVGGVKFWLWLPISYHEEVSIVQNKRPQQRPFPELYALPTITHTQIRLDKSVRSESGDCLGRTIGYRKFFRVRGIYFPRSRCKTVIFAALWEYMFGRKQGGSPIVHVIRSPFVRHYFVVFQKTIWQIMWEDTNKQPVTRTRHNTPTSAKNVPRRVERKKKTIH